MHVEEPEIAKSLVNKIKTGEEQIFRELYKKHLPKVISHVQKNGGTEGDAIDLFQNAIMVLYEKARNNQLQLTADVGTYLFAICKYGWMNKLKERSKFVVSNELPLSIEDEPLMLEREERYSLYLKKFSSLKNDCQRFLKLYFKKIKMKTIAKEMGYKSEQYAWKKNSDCKKKLVHLIQNDPKFKDLKYEL